MEIIWHGRKRTHTTTSKNVARRSSPDSRSFPAATRTGTPKRIAKKATANHLVVSQATIVARQAGLRTLKVFGLNSYADFLLSDFWTQTRWAILIRDKGKCRICGSPATECHHLLYTDDLCDKDFLIAVCRQCHRRLHLPRGPVRRRICPRCSAHRQASEWWWP